MTGTVIPAGLPSTLLKPILRTLCTVALCAAVAGCATMAQREGADVHQFDPAPVAKIGKEELRPVPTRSVSELLRKANVAFQAANESQEKGDHQAALRHYNHMLELLIEADLDPRLFYDLRDEFDRILDSSSDLAKRYEGDFGKGYRPLSERGGVVAPKSDLAYPYPLPERVLKEIDLIQAAYPKNFSRGLERSGRFLPYIRQEFRKAGLPDDLVWLAMVESQFSPKIDSPVGAGGMWQFMNSTARRYGLQIDSYVDERYDWKKSTQAAIRYLTDLYEMFGDWPIAVSAYNKGEGGMERAIAAGGGQKNLWALMENSGASAHLPQETKKFYPKLLASAIVAKSPARYGFTARPYPTDNSVYISVTGSYSIKELEKAAKLPKDTLTSINPQFIRGATPPNRTSELMVPADASERVRAALAAVPKSRPGVHVVKSGETLSRIASRYKVSVQSLMNANRIKSARALQVGQRLTIPGVDVEEAPETGVVLASLPSSAPRPAASATTTTTAPKTYKVSRGDTLSTIATQSGATVEQLQSWNNLGTRTRIRVGDTLVVGNESRTRVATASPKSTHTVAKGEFLGKIAEKYNVGVEELASWNGKSVNDTLLVGETLTVYGGGNAPTKAGDEPVYVEHVHVVAKGESPSVIASRYDISTAQLLAWNNLHSNDVIHVGDKLEVKLPIDTTQEPKTMAKADGDAFSGQTRATHVVTRGQNPTTIARRYGVSLSELFEWNGWVRNPVLQVGDKVVVYTQ